MSGFRESWVQPAGEMPTFRSEEVPAAGSAVLSLTSSAGLTHLKGADQPADLARQLDQWHVAVTSPSGEPRFTLGDRLGAGAQGVVYRMADRDCRREVAMKNLRAEDCDAADISRFVHEAQITAQLEHPGIVPVHDFGMLPDGTAFYTMKRVEGENLADWMANRKGRSEHRFDLLSCFMRICESMEFAHSKGVIHRDLKPRNIMVGRFGEVLVMDWGLAKVVGVAEGGGVASLRSDGESSSGDIHRTLEGLAVGTPAYMSPEQACGDSHLVDQRSDLYALGVILYEMLSGESPYLRGGVRRTLDQVAHGQILPIDESKLGDGGHRLAAIVQKAMALDREHRYASANDLIRDLRNFLAGQAVSAYRENAIEAGLRRYRRHRRPILAACGLAALVSAVFAGLLYRDARRESAEIAQLHHHASAGEAVGNLAEARKDYEYILARQPADDIARRGLERVEERIDAELEAEQQRRARIDNIQRADALLVQARELQAGGNLKEAIIRAEEAQNRRPNPDGRALLRELDEAFAAEEKTAAKARQRREADDFLAQLREALAAGNADQAARLLEQARGKDADHPALSGLETLVADAQRSELARLVGEWRGKAGLSLVKADEFTGQVDALSQSIVLLQAELNEHGRPETRAALHLQEQEFEKLARLRSAHLVDALSKLQHAHAMDPSDVAVRRDLADYFIERLRDAERSGDSAVAEANAAQARIFDDGSQAKLLAGLGTLSLVADAGQCRLTRLGAGPDRTDVPSGEPVMMAPGAAVDLPHGRYLVEAEGGARFACRLERGKTLALDPPSLPRLPSGTVFIPKGRAYGRDGRPPHEVAAFAIQEREVTCGEWLEFLNDPATLRTLAERRRQDGILKFVPREGVTQDIEPLWRQRGMSGRSATGTFMLELTDRTPVDPQQPVNWISHDDAVAYAAWLADRTKQRWRLPTRWEWELAAQGGDGRAYAWGPHADVSLCYSSVSAKGRSVKTLLAGGSFTADRTVQGACDMAGSLAEFVLDGTADPAFGAVMGGAHSDRQVDRFTTWSRREIMRQLATSWCGIRLALDLP